MIAALSISAGKMLVTIEGGKGSLHVLERHKAGEDGHWLVYTEGGFAEKGEGVIPLAVPSGDVLDTFNLEKALYAYRIADAANPDPAGDDWEYSNWARNSTDDAIGYTFGNYKPAPGTWGTIVTPDDIRYTYIWGTDFKATNGQSYSDGQIQYFIDAATEDIGRRLDITIKKKKCRCRAAERGLEKGKDYDVDEGLYDFRLARISRYGLIKTRQKPIIRLHRLSLLSRLSPARELAGKVIVDKTKGLLKLMERPVRPTETSSAIQTAVGMYGNETTGGHLFYSIDYDAGFETSDDVPEDLREIVAKQASVHLLNIIGDGLMSGFSSSSLSMDGLSESFSSTQSATSAYFGARIKEYKDDIDLYIQQNRNKFGHIALGCL